MKKIFAFLTLVFVSVISVYADNELDSLLKALDDKVKHDKTYIELKENRIKGLKNKKLYTDVGKKNIYLLNKSLYEEYKSYISDSALHYLNKNLDISHSLNHPYKINETNIAIARLCSSLGMYSEAFDAIAQVTKDDLDKKQIICYYLCYKNIYGGLALYTQNKKSKSK